MPKHAYLIEAHDNYFLLCRLIEMLDDYRNDIYVHIDKKSKKVPIEYMKKLVNHSKIYFVDRIKVTWGGYSQIQCEINLLKAAAFNHYEYYHLISGRDLPIKTQDEIHAFFKKNKGYEFIEFASESFNKQAKYRYSIFHIFQNMCGKSNSILALVNKIFVKLQIFIDFPNRGKKIDMKFCGGSNWFSITDDLVKYIILKEEEIKKIFNYSFCCDEIFIQTFVYNSQFYNKVYMNKFQQSCKSNLRYVDWKKGNPYVLKYCDYDKLIESECFFARKFGTETDEELFLVEKLFNQIKN